MAASCSRMVAAAAVRRQVLNVTDAAAERIRQRKRPFIKLRVKAAAATAYHKPSTMQQLLFLRELPQSIHDGHLEESS